MGISITSNWRSPIATVGFGIFLLPDRLTFHSRVINRCVCSIGIKLIEVVTFSWTPRPGGEPPYGKVQQGAARQGRGPVHQIRALRRGRDTRTRLSQQGDAAGVVPGTPRGGTHRKTVHSRETVPAVHGRAETGRGGPLPRTRQASETHHARARLSEKP